MAPSTCPEPGQLSALLADLARVPEAVPEDAWAPALRPGSRVGRYELRAELGRGSFGVVYEALDLEARRPVAFKVVRPGKREVGADQLQREAETIARLSHPALVALHDVGRCEAGPYLVLELLRGRTLKARLAEGMLPPADGLRVALQAAEGLAHAHARGVVHRDLKPSNVFLCDDGTVRLLDFGLAHAFGRRRLDGGTPDYMAPEQWRGAPEDERTDVFALGVLLYRMLSGELPFPDDGGRSASSPRPAPRLEVPDLPGLGELVGRMLEKDPVGRPRDAAAVADLLRPLVPEDGSTLASGSGSVRIRRRSHRRRAVVAALLGLLALGAVLGGATVAVRRQRQARPAAAHDLPSVAVIPFADLSAGQDQAYFSDGLAEEILNALAQLPGLKVAGRTSSFAFRGREGDLAAIGRQLGVAAVLEGSVRLDGTRVRVTAQLVKTADGYHLWSQTFDRELRGVFAVQDEIAAAVAEALRVQLLAGRSPSSKEFRTRDPQVYSLYLQGRQLQRGDARGDWRRSEAVLTRALDLDPGYAPAWAALASALFENHGNLGPSAEAVQAGQARALAAAERAVALAPDLADGYTARGQHRLFARRDWAGASADMARAIVLSPGDPDALWRNARYVLGPAGRLEEALQQARRASELDPLSYKPWSTLAALHLGAGQLAQARAAAVRSLELEPSQWSALTCLATVELVEERPGAAIEVIRRIDEPLFQLQFEAMARHRMGQPRASERALQALVAQHAQDAPYQVATVHAWRGEADEAFRWLERAVDQGDGGVLDLRLEPFFRPLEGDPRYRAVLARLGLP
ncbi:MAG: protein kinase [Anaeromyxobacteraceae bacterium]|nr:protein kinase [Anaeromyxobacteraceae bacterium]